MVRILTVIAVGMSASTATTTGGTTTAASLCLLPDQYHLETDLLKSQLVTGPAEETEGSLRGLEGGAQLDTHGLAKEIGKVVLHLPVENERDIGVQLLLKLEELLLPVLPGAGLEHGEHQDILTGIVGKGVEHSGSLDSGSRRRAVRAGQIFADGNHT